MSSRESIIPVKYYIKWLLIRLLKVPKNNYNNEYTLDFADYDDDLNS